MGKIEIHRPADALAEEDEVQHVDGADAKDGTRLEVVPDLMVILGDLPLVSPEARTPQMAGFNEDVRRMFLENYVRFDGAMVRSALACGVSYETVRIALRDDECFRDAFGVVQQQFRESIATEIHRRGVRGVQEPIIGGENKDEVVTYVRKYSDRLLEMHARRHIPAYRDRVQQKEDEETGRANPTGTVAGLDLSQLTARGRDLLRELIQEARRGQPVTIEGEVVPDAD